MHLQDRSVAEDSVRKALPSLGFTDSSDVFAGSADGGLIAMCLVSVFNELQNAKVVGMRSSGIRLTLRVDQPRTKMTKAIVEIFQ